MEPETEAGRRLDGMAEGMAQVEKRAPAGLALIFSDERRLELARAAHGMDERRAFALEKLGDVRLQPGEEDGVEGSAVVDDIGDGDAEFSIGEGVVRRR